jgi:hypothetical protein
MSNPLRAVEASSADEETSNALNEGTVERISQGALI